MQYKEKSPNHFLRAFAVIQDWVQDKGRESTVDVLIKVCKECGIHPDNVVAAYREQIDIQ